ncbi:MAG TPA: ankyrin repeat domain-containing protein [Blastocatellia bacterium]|nr:ankyrin repeat domain-containing protein [Blastocatellia bacterium]
MRSRLALELEARGVRTDGVPPRVQKEIAGLLASATPESINLEIELLRRELAGAPSSYGTSILHSAAVRGYAHLIQPICERWPDLIEAKTTFGDTPLMEAASWGRDSCLVMLRSCGASIHATNAAKMTALHNAAADGQSGSVALLKRWSTDLTPIDVAGWTPVRWALENEHRLCAELLGWLPEETQQRNLVPPTRARALRQLSFSFVPRATPKRVSPREIHPEADIQFLPGQLSFSSLSRPIHPQ